jgi:hypothetical protein
VKRVPVVLMYEDVPRLTHDKIAASVGLEDSEMSIESIVIRSYKQLGR